MWRLSNHGSDREESVDKTLDAPRHKKSLRTLFSPYPSPHPPRKSPGPGAGGSADGSHMHWLAEPPSGRFCTSLVPSSGFAIHLPPDARPHLALLSCCQAPSTLAGRWELVLSAPSGRPGNPREAQGRQCPRWNSSSRASGLRAAHTTLEKGLCLKSQDWQWEPRALSTQQDASSTSQDQPILQGCLTGLVGGITWAKAADKVSVGLPTPRVLRATLLRKESRGKGFLCKWWNG